MVENPFATQPEPLFKPNSNLKKLAKRVVAELSELDSEGRYYAVTRFLGILEQKGDITPVATVTIEDHLQNELSLRADLKTRS